MEKDRRVTEYAPGRENGKTWWVKHYDLGMYGLGWGGIYDKD